MNSLRKKKCQECGGDSWWQGVEQELVSVTRACLDHAFQSRNFQLKILN